jgi:biotin carboxylase
MADNKTIMILGAGQMQIPAIKAAQELGLTVAAVDGCATAHGVNLADIFEKIDLGDQQSLLAFAEQLRHKRGLDAVFTAGTDFSASVAYVAEKLGLPGHRYEAALNATHKDRMRRVLTEHGVNCPQFTQASSESNINDLLAAIELWNNGRIDAVVKPVDNMGGRGVIRIGSKAALKDALALALNQSRSRRAIIEEYIEGDELSIDSLVFEENHVICGVADRHVFYPPYFIEMGHTIPSSLPKAKLDTVISEFKKGVRALGLTHGAAKGDMKINDRGAFVGEIAARLSGGYMSGWTYPYASGVNLTKEAIRLALGMTDLDLEPKRQLFCAERAFISIPGEVSSIEELASPREVAGFKELFMRAGIGDRVSLPTNNVEKCGNIISIAEESEKAAERAERACKYIFIRLKADDKETKEFLFKNEESPVPLLEAAGHDINGLNREEIAEYFHKLTGAAFEEITDNKFTAAVNKGGLQGAVWYFDTYRNK